MLITKEWLKSKSACTEGYEWSLKQKGFDTGIEVIKFLGMLVDDNHWNWANWVIVRVMTPPQYLAYAIYAAEQVIDIYEKEYPKDDRPRKAINAAKEVLRSDTVGNRDAAMAAAEAAMAAAGAAEASAWAAAWAAEAAANNSMRKEILDYGISLLITDGGRKE